MKNGDIESFFPQKWKIELVDGLFLAAIAMIMRSRKKTRRCCVLRDGFCELAKTPTTDLKQAFRPLEASRP
jgi:hypothetical protein